MESSNGLDYFHNYDIVFKWIGNILQGHTLKPLGVETGKIIEVRGLEPVTLQAREERVDLLLKDDCGHYYHLEEERHLSRKDIFRFAAQHFLISEQIKSENLTTVLLASGEVTSRLNIDTPSARFTPIIIDLSRRDGKEKFAEIRRQERPDPVDLMFLPMYNVTMGKREDFAGEVVLYVKSLYLQKKITLEFLGAVLILCNKIISPEVLRSIWREVQMLQIFKDIEKIATEKGMEKGIIDGLSTALEIKFGTAGLHALTTIEQMDLRRLSLLKDIVKNARSLDEFERRLADLAKQ